MRTFLKLSNQRGAAAVEFAIVLPLLLFFFVGITEFGIVYYNKQVVTNASREGARAGIKAGTNEDDIKELVKDYIIGSPLITFGINPFTGNDYKDNITVIPPDADNYLTVSVEFDYTYLLLAGFKFFGADFGTSLTIEASTVMATQ